ncbi:Nn.00g070700.m01.CDS01 [Neocucurbitaria sp. VM-36]
MSSSPLDTDANTRDTGSRFHKASQIPNPPVANRASGSGRRSPFSVSATGSPRLMPMSPPPRTTVSPAVTSKIPRKSQTPVHDNTPGVNKSSGLPILQHSSLPTYGARTPMATPTPMSAGLKNLAHSTARNKPLPSPPIVQVIDPNSPPKAQRTLVDAEAGSPSEEEWPIIRPGNVSPLTNQMSRVKNMDVQQQRSVSMGAAPRHVANSYFANAKHSPANMINTSSASGVNFSPTQEEHSRYQQNTQMTQSHRWSSNNPYANNNFHAISTDTDSAMESPLAHKKAAANMLPIPPRLSSNRSSLPLPSQNKPDSFTPPSRLQLRQVKEESEKWPLLKRQDTEQSVASDSSSLPKEQTVPNMSAQVESQDAQHATLGDPQSTGLDHTVQSPSGSVRSDSSCSVATSSSLDVETGTDHEGSTRVRQLSRHSSTSKSGPVLTIFPDADAVILGRGIPIPDVPALSDKVPEKVSQERSLSALAGRLSRQTMSKISLSLASHSSTSNLTEAVPKATTPVKINPIRSMQPPRKSSTGGISPVVSSPVSYMSVGPKEPTRSALMPSSVSKNADAGRSKIGSLLRDREVGPKFSTSHADTPKLSRTVQPRDAGRLEGLPMLSSSKSAVSMRSNPPSGQLTALDDEQKTEGSAPVSTPSPPDDGSTKALIVENSSEAKDPSTKKLKIKRSFREIFQRGGIKRPEKPTTTIEPEQSFMSGTRSSLAKRIRTSASRVHLPRMAETKSELQDIPEPATEGTQAVATGSPTKHTELANRKAALSTLETGLLGPASESAPIPRNNTATAITNVVDRIATLPSDSPDRLRGVQIAEVCQMLHFRSIVLDELVLTVKMKQALLDSVTYYEQALLSAENARKDARDARSHARDARVNAERVGIELIRLQEMCEPILDGKTVETVKERMKSVGLGDKPT